MKTLANAKILRAWPLITLTYPMQWAKEYKRTGFVNQWRSEYKAMFKDYKSRTGKERGTLRLFPQYALMYLLRKREGIHSITWYKIANVSPKSANQERTLKHWATMKKWMGEENFLCLQKHLVMRDFTTISGEPDLFCWNPKNGKWFFAEAKGRDTIRKSQERWREVCHQVLPEAAICLYRLMPREER